MTSSGSNPVIAHKALVDFDDAAFGVTDQHRLDSLVDRLYEEIEPGRRAILLAAASVRCASHGGSSSQLLCQNGGSGKGRHE